MIVWYTGEVKLLVYKGNLLAITEYPMEECMRPQYTPSRKTEEPHTALKTKAIKNKRDR
jgi:hypothetical protein